MVLEVYGNTGSPHCRIVFAVLKHLKIPYEQKTLDMRNKEHLQADYLKLNPFHTIPTINDDGFAVFESRAIAVYLIEKYSPDNQLYPNDAKKRAAINRWLYWDVASFLKSLQSYNGPFLFGNVDKPDEKAANEILDKVKTLDGLLSQSKYINGDNLTLADIGLAITFASINATNLDTKPFENVNKWFNRLENDLPEVWSEIIVKPNEMLKKRWTDKLSASK
ncbi:glutathione S-transferase 1-1-like [Panonychus citri]|uniref:glutathione S-transferase 1-1-like n=1 Tax=Panonychus citri TaxID=50023 RepID=UPI002306DF5A|nr:glutathione S-transferase 1-1-like [Panonychus citri]